MRKQIGESEADNVVFGIQRGRFSTAVEAHCKYELLSLTCAIGAQVTLRLIITWKQWKRLLKNNFRTLYQTKCQFDTFWGTLISHFVFLVILQFVSLLTMQLLGTKVYYANGNIFPGDENRIIL